jgi:hypothetical protein
MDNIPIEIGLNHYLTAAKANIWLAQAEQYANNRLIETLKDVYARYERNEPQEVDVLQSLWITNILVKFKEEYIRNHPFNPNRGDIIAKHLYLVIGCDGHFRLRCNTHGKVYPLKGNRAYSYGHMEKALACLSRIKRFDKRYKDYTILHGFRFSTPEGAEVDEEKFDAYVRIMQKYNVKPRHASYWLRRDRENEWQDYVSVSYKDFFGNKFGVFL